MSFKEEVIGECRLFLGDCREVIPTLGRVGAVVLDPPYLFDAAGAGLMRTKHVLCMKEIIKDELNNGFDHRFLTQELCDSVVCFCHNDQLEELIPWLSQNFGRYAVCMWHKENPLPVANKHYRPDTEFYIHAWNERGYPVGDLRDKNRWVLHPMGISDYDHPTVKPIPLMLKVIKNVNAELILDPYMGTGSTGVACAKLGKKFIGVEKNEKHFSTACRRIDEFYRQGDFFALPVVRPVQEKIF